MIQPRFWFLIAITLYAVIVRLIPYVLSHFGMEIHPETTTYPWNFSPLPALCLFCGACFTQVRWAFAVPLLTYAVGDLGILLLTGDPNMAFYGSMFSVYLGNMLIVAIGLLLRHRRSVWSVGAAGLGAGAMFFLLTNFCVWAFESWHPFPRTPSGLLACYTFALPFFRNYLIGLAVFLPLFFSPIALARREQEAADFGGLELAPAPVRVPESGSR